MRNYKNAERKNQLPRFLTMGSIRGVSDRASPSPEVGVAATRSRIVTIPFSLLPDVTSPHEAVSKITRLGIRINVRSQSPNGVILIEESTGRAKRFKQTTSVPPLDE